MSSRIILASRSPRRKLLLSRIGLKADVIPSHVKENIAFNLSAEHQVILTAMSKAEAVAKKLKRGLIIAADTIVILDNKIIGKPKNRLDAKRILSALNNSKHHVYTAIAAVDAKHKKRLVDIEKTTVYTRKVSAARLEKLAAKNHDKAGAYAVQEKGDEFICKIEGDFYNVVGLPLKKLLNILSCFGINKAHLHQLYANYRKLAL